MSLRFLAPAQACSADSRRRPVHAATTLTQGVYGRPDYSWTTSDGSTYRFRRRYDSYGRLRDIQYPTAGGERLTVRYQYDSAGHQTRATIPGSSGGTIGGITTDVTSPSPTDNGSIQLWTLTEVDDAGRLKAEAFGNGLVTRRTFDPTTGLIGTIRTLQPNGSPIQDLNYAYERNGNVEVKIDKVVPSYLGSTAIATTWYKYDGANRLHNESGAKASGELGLHDFFDRSTTYDAFGNINNIPGIGDIESIPEGRIRTVNGSQIYEYDANGNVIEDPERSLTYTAQNKILTVDTGEGELQFEYDADGTRVKTAADGATTTFVEDLYHVLDAGNGFKIELFRIVAGGRVVAERYRLAGSWLPPYYLHDDAQGSTQVVTDSLGKPQNVVDYDAWGLSADTGVDLVVNPAYPSATGFTGHPAQQDAGLINMGGRMYDPVMRRFLSADPFRQFPFDTQASAYTYVRNNPATHTDSTGHWVDHGPHGLDPFWPAAGGAAGAGLKKLWNWLEEGLDGSESSLPGSIHGSRSSSAPPPVSEHRRPSTSQKGGRYASGIGRAMGSSGSWYSSFQDASIAGFGSAAYETATGLWQVASHPVETTEALWNLGLSAYEDPAAAWDTVSAGAVNLASGVYDDIASGDPTRIGNLVGRGVFEIAATLTGTKAASAVANSARAARIARLEALAARGGKGGQRFFRGARPGEAPNFTPRPNDFKVDKSTGFVKDSHGVSVFDNAESVSTKGFVPHEVDQSTIPSTLRIKQRGRDPSHYEITPAPGVNLTPDEYINACQAIGCLL